MFSGDLIRSMSADAAGVRRRGVAVNAESSVSGQTVASARVPRATGVLRVIAVVGARPNFMKVAPIVREMAAAPESFSCRIVHTGQHYDAAMSEVFFDQLAIPRPDLNLEIGSGSHAQQTAAVMQAFEPVLLQQRPDLVIVVGDVNSTLACALVAVKLGIPVAHVEAGLRSGDRTMPEEINRILTDQISDLLFTTERSAAEHLKCEGVGDEKVFFVGNVMIDTLLAHRSRAAALRRYEDFGLVPRGYALLTLHRPSNVDDPIVFTRLLAAIDAIAVDTPILFPVHPRTRPAIMASDAAKDLISRGNLRLLDPLGYLDFLSLMDASAAVLTDSGGIQEETTVLGVPCLTLRENTERPATVTEGTNQIVGTDPERIVSAWRRLRREPMRGRTPERWDGQAARRIAAVLERWSAEVLASRALG